MLFARCDHGKITVDVNIEAGETAEDAEYEKI